MSTFHRVGSIADLSESARFATSVEGKKIAIFAIDGRYHATDAICPHANGELWEGDLDGTKLTCPWHGLEFDLATGECVDDPCLKVNRYAVKVDGDDLLVEI